MKAKIIYSPYLGYQFITNDIFESKEQRLKIMTDKILIKSIENNNKNKFKNRMFELMGGKHNDFVYDFSDLEVGEVDTERDFLINEYDGSESIHYIDELEVYNIKELV